MAVGFDHVIESFRNDLFHGYKTGDGIDPLLRGQFELQYPRSALWVLWWPPQGDLRNLRSERYPSDHGRGPLGGRARWDDSAALLRMLFCIRKLKYGVTDVPMVDCE